MKHHLLILIIATSISCNAPRQFFQEMNMSEIIDAPGMTKNELYVDINSWMAEIFVNRETVIQFQDKEAGKVIGKFKHEFGDGNKRDFILEFDIRDYSFRISMNGNVNTYERNDSTSDWFDPENNVYYRHNPDEVPLTEELFSTLISELVEYLNGKENW